ncbi:hypothetical protein HZS61_004825 [Fusarium oxysporum f. sp. conglutinans]|uniref:Uncharacterized protein n=1 Tax=Fusarium oxysporum f. sp. conglutinans TaxID=100902 RepID=A0A8H6GDB0_FUSOX|nr:hypothetical protein HZS61_004825 [Fusarium oxysporum f. sp. conglutinans]
MKFLCNVLLFCALANSATLAIPKSKQFTSSNFLLESRAQHQTRDVKNRTSYIWNGGEVAGPRFASVTAEVIIPNITFPYGYNASARYGSSVWVGIGGDQNTCDDPARINNGGLIQGGYYYLYDPEGDFGVFAFYEWFPDGPVFLDDTEGIETAIGDHVRMTVTQKDNVTGSFTWENFTSDKKFTKELKAPVNGTLCTNHAEWIVESFMTTKDHDTLFPDFGELHFTDIKAISAANEEVSLQEHGIIVEAEPVLGNGKYLTDLLSDEMQDTTPERTKKRNTAKTEHGDEIEDIDVDKTSSALPTSLRSSSQASKTQALKPEPGGARGLATTTQRPQYLTLDKITLTSLLDVDVRSHLSPEDVDGILADARDASKWIMKRVLGM